MPVLQFVETRLSYTTEMVSSLAKRCITARIKAIPPTISYFQDINRTINKTSAGILCINNPTAICQKLNSGEITSNENNAKKHINIMDRILGVQYKLLLIFIGLFFTSTFIAS